MNRQILTIGLSDETNDVIKKYFALDCMQVVACQNADEARVHLREEHHRLIVYNASELSTDDAQEYVSRMRRATYAPILMITKDKAAAATLEAGADMCLPPNVNAHMLFAVAMGLIRRNECFSQYDDAHTGPIVLYRADLMIDSTRHHVTQSGADIQLLPQEFRLLAFMARNAEVVLTAEQISPAIWLDDNHQHHDVTRIVSTLRQKLNDDPKEPRYIQTVHGVGYRFLPMA